MEENKLSHSHSQPGGIDRTPPGTPKKGGKMLAVRVQMLDDTITMFQVQAKALGKVLFDQVCKQLHLLESDYFGLEYHEMGGTKYWLDLEKPLSRQIGLSLLDTLVRFCVKFYTPDPAQLEEEFTRYLFCLQIKRDLSHGLLQCNDNTAALMASYIVQAECGDYVYEDYPDHRYLSSYKFVPNQDQELERRIMENHKKHAGQPPAEADLNLLETARRCELYGIKMHSAKDHEGVPLNLAVAHMGILVFQNYTKINTFSWGKIRKISFKRKRFLIKLHPEGYGYYKDTVEFFFEGRNECKNFWKKCVENHGFFRCTTVKRKARQKTRVLSRGSSFRYSGRTQKQIVEFVRENYVKRQTFQRSQSFRHSSSAHSSVANVGTSISAHPLLPLGDNAVAGTPASLSCGSMTLNSSPLHTADIHVGGSPSPPLTTSVSPGTSVTSSPQHFYPQESPYRRTAQGHQTTRLKPPRQQSHQHVQQQQQQEEEEKSSAVITNVTSANHINNINNNNNNNNKEKTFKSLTDNVNFNDVYSNTYNSLRNLRNLSSVGDEMKERSKSKVEISKGGGKRKTDELQYPWHRSSSCKDLYQELDQGEDDNSINNNNIYSEIKHVKKLDYDSPVTRYDDTRRNCYSSAERTTGDVVAASDNKIYSSSYPGTTSSVSTESVDVDGGDVVRVDVVDMNDSQDDNLYSHDDLSHDSYELLEREPDEEEMSSQRSGGRRGKSRGHDNDRARSCSWSSERNYTDGFRSLERKSNKNRDELEFRSLDRKRHKEDYGRKSPRGGKSPQDECRERRRSSSREYVDQGNHIYAEVRRKSHDIDEDVFHTPECFSPMDNRNFSPSALEEEALLRTLERESKQRRKSREYDEYSTIDKVKKYQDRRKSREEIEIFPMDSEEEFVREEQRRAEERRKQQERRREKREKEERFHEGMKEKERRNWEKEQKELEKERREFDREVFMDRMYEEEKMRRSLLLQMDDEELRIMQSKQQELLGDFEESLKKSERVVSNQFGKYSEFLGYDKEYELLLQEKKVLENYEKVCQVEKIAKELAKTEKALKAAETMSNVNALYAEVKKPDKRKQLKEEPVSSAAHFKEYNAKCKGGVVLGFGQSPKSSPKLGKHPVERTKSDPYETGSKSLRRNVLTHQKSIDLTPQDSAEAASDYDDSIRKTSKSEYDIPYTLHKRHCMNGTAKEHKPEIKKKPVTIDGKTKPAVAEKKSPIDKVPMTKKSSLEEPRSAKSSTPSPKRIIDKKKIENRDIEIINMDVSTEVHIVDVKKPKPLVKSEKPKPAVKPVIKPDSAKMSSPRLPAKKNNEVAKTIKAVSPPGDVAKTIKAVSPPGDVAKKIKAVSPPGEVAKTIKAVSPPGDVAKKIKAVSPPGDVAKTIKAVSPPGDVAKTKKQISPPLTTKEKPPTAAKPTILDIKPVDTDNVQEDNSAKKVPPEPPKRTTSVPKTPDKKSEVKFDGTEPKVPERTTSLQRTPTTPTAPTKKVPPEPPRRTTSITKLSAEKSPETSSTSETGDGSKNGVASREMSQAEVNEPNKLSDLKQITCEMKMENVILHKREESLILFARTRLGLSEGSAFTPVVRQLRIGSPNSQRRAKSLDAPVVSLNRLPPADAFSSKDDTLDGVENEVVVKSIAARAAEFLKIDPAPPPVVPIHHAVTSVLSTESEVESLVPDDLGVDENFKEIVESQSKLEMSFSEDKVSLLDGVRSKRLLSKIESVDNADSEIDSSKTMEPIPSDRIVNLPESVRFPSVRQISGQTSEESVDGWDQREVKVKRRAPRKSVGRDEPESGKRESVVWDSKDEEQPPDDDVWDDNVFFKSKHDPGQIITDSVVASEYLKRGSCGQSIDDDNVSTPMKESSPEHWVSVDDLPEAIEREERLLKEQDKILREKILNEKLKRELNLDTIDVDERIYRENMKHSFEEVPVILKDKFKGHSLDTYELTERRLREHFEIKNQSLDEYVLRCDTPVIDIKDYLTVSSSTLDASDKSSSYENVPKLTKDKETLEPDGGEYFKVVKDVTDIQQLVSNDGELEEFVVVLDEKVEKLSTRESSWDDASFPRTVSKEESLISVPEEFKDSVDVEDVKKVVEGETPVQAVEIRLESERKKTGEEHLLEAQRLEERLKLAASLENLDREDGGRLSPYDGSRRGSDDPRRLSNTDDPGRLSPFSGSRRGSEEPRRLSASDDTGRLSPYDSSRRSSEGPRLSTSDDPGRLSPYDDSRRGSADPRRLSTASDGSRRPSASEDSRKYSFSEDSRRFSTSVSEETRRRLSSTEEARRKRASLTKQCSVGVDSLSDDVLPGVLPECSSSFEQDEKEVFESVLPLDPDVPKQTTSDPTEGRGDKGVKEIRSVLEIEVSQDNTEPTENVDDKKADESESSSLLAPPKGERELSRETEDSVDYCEGDLREIREAVKEKDISDGLICDNESAKSSVQNSCKLPSSFEKSESSEGDELRFIDEKRGSTPEMIVGRGKDTTSLSVVVINEGIAVLDKLVEQQKACSLPRDVMSKPTTDKIPDRHTLPKRNLTQGLRQKPPITPKPDYSHKKLTKVIPNVSITKPEKLRAQPISQMFENQHRIEISRDSSGESDGDRLFNEISILAKVQGQISRRNLSQAGKQMKNEQICLKTSRQGSDETEATSVDVSPMPKDEGRMLEETRTRRGNKTPGDQEKRDSGEDGSSSSSAPPNPKRELSSTWRPFLLESSGSSSLEEGWLPPDDNAHLADEEETSSTSNKDQDDSGHDDVIDYPANVGYPVLNISSAEMIVGGYSSVFSLSRTLSRISERSTTSEQERSDIEDDITKPSLHSASEEESILSSDHQPSLSSDPPSPKLSKIPDLPEDKVSVDTLEGFVIPDDKNGSACEPFTDVIPPPLPDEDWPSPPDSSGMFDTPVVSHVETFYMEIHPEEAHKVHVAGGRHDDEEDDDCSSDENHTLHEESELNMHLSSDNLSVSTTTTTQDGTVIVPVRPKNSISEDTSMISNSEWSSSATKPRKNSNFGTSEDLSDWTKDTTTKSDVWSSNSSKDQCMTKGDEETFDWPSTSSRYYTESPERKNAFDDEEAWYKTRPKLKSPTTKNIGFFETPVSKVRSPTSHGKFFEKPVGIYANLKSPTYSDSSGGYVNVRSPSEKTFKERLEYYEKAKHGKFFEGSSGSRGRTKKPVCIPYYSNLTESEKSYFDRYDTGSLERTKIHSGRKCQSYYSVVKSPPSDDDSSSPGAPSSSASNTIPRACKRTKKRHRVAMDLQIRDGGKQAEDIPDTPVTDLPRDNSLVISSTPKQNGDVNHVDERSYSTSPNLTRQLITEQKMNGGSERSRLDSNESVERSYVINNNNNNVTMSETNKIEGVDVRKKKYNTDKTYFIAKELLSTERTYRKDLEVINFWFRDEISKENEDMPSDVLNVLFALIQPLNEFHNSFLRDIELRLATWEGKSNTNGTVKTEHQRIGDVILHNLSILPLYDQYIDKHHLVLERLDSSFRKNKKFELLYRDFEQQKVCYLPLSSFILKPLQRLLHYNNIINRLIEHHSKEHPDHSDCLKAQSLLSKTISQVPPSLLLSENFVQLSELQRDMPGFEGLIQVGRDFIRQGCLLKHSRKGYQQRMFFLFSDILVYTNRTTTPVLQFKVHGQMPLRGVMVEDVDEKMGANYCFIIYGGNRALTVAASSQEEKDKWMEDIAEAVQHARDKTDGRNLHYLSLKSCSSSDEVIDKITGGSSEENNTNRDRVSQQRSNTTVHVCWHRNTSTSLKDHIRAFENELSGFLLRKFKNSNGWQKLWVVFTNFCLFFYKTYQDDAPLASLPLLGYTVTLPSEHDSINKDYVFKLQFKNHVYFFRAESEYTFARWMEVIRSATSHSGRIRLFSRKDSSLNSSS